MNSGSDGRFGPFGGQYIPETLMPAVQFLERVAGIAGKPFVIGFGCGH